jgi:hypothetical protein
MLSPALASKAAHTKADAVNTPAVMTTTSAGIPHTKLFAVLEPLFVQDKKTIETVRSRARRVEVKRKCLTQYQEWLEVYRVADLARVSVNHRSMYIWLLLWHIDVGQWERALVLAEPALKAKLTAPEGFNRSLIEMVVEEISKGVLGEEQPEHYGALLMTLLEWSQGYDLHDFIRAKLYKACGLAFSQDIPKAVGYLEQAHKLNPRSGVQRLIKTLTTPKTAKQKASKALHGFSLSASAAARMLGMTVPTFLRRAKKHPEQLPCLALPMGSRTFYRFKRSDVKAFLDQHVVNTTQESVA